MIDMTVGNPQKIILRFALPMLLGNVLQQFYNIIDSIVVGKFVGKEALAAVGASFPLLFALVSFIIGIAMGSTIIISQYFGAKDIEKVKKTISTMLISLMVASIIVSIIGLIFIEPIFRLTKLPEDVMPEAISYMRVLLLGIVVFFGYNGISGILRGLGDSITPLYFLLISTILNIGIDLLFVIVFHWGIEGVAIATLISQGAAFLFAVLYLNKTHEIIKVKPREMIFDKEIFKKSLNIGFPQGMQNTIVAVGIMAIFRLVNDFGTNTVAAYSVGSRINSIAAMPAMIFGAALSTYVGQNLGANKMERVKAGLWATIKISSVVAISVSIIVVLFNHSIMKLFTNDLEVIKIGAVYFIIVGAFYLIFNLMFVIGGVMRGAGDTWVPMFITFLALWVFRIPISIFLSNKIGIVGIWWGEPIGWFVGMSLSFAYYFSGKWKNKVIVKHKIP